MALEIPKHAQADVGDVDDVGAEGDGSVRIVGAVGTLSRQRLDEARQVLV